MKGKQLSLFPEEADHVWVNDYVPFVSEVEEFNKTFNKPNNYEPTIPARRIRWTGSLLQSLDFSPHPAIPGIGHPAPGTKF